MTSGFAAAGLFCWVDQELLPQRARGTRGRSKQESLVVRDTVLFLALSSFARRTAEGGCPHMNLG